MITKECGRCKEEKSLDEFTFTLLGKDQKKSICKSCLKISNKAYYDKRRKEYTESLRGNV